MTLYANYGSATRIEFHRPGSNCHTCMQVVKPQVSKALYYWGAFITSSASGGASDEHHSAWRKQMPHRSLSSATVPAEVPCSQISLPSHPRLVTVSEPWELQEALGAADVHASDQRTPRSYQISTMHTSYARWCTKATYHEKRLRTTSKTVAQSLPLTRRRISLTPNSYQ